MQRMCLKRAGIYLAYLLMNLYVPVHCHVNPRTTTVL
uniref:Uncharacterized protein n=2 Tax=Anguilla anguilla TaxID=7936 RepID=A0A0E9PKA4_ANGAN